MKCQEKPSQDIWPQTPETCQKWWDQGGLTIAFLDELLQDHLEGVIDLPPIFRKFISERLARLIRFRSPPRTGPGSWMI